MTVSLIFRFSVTCFIASKGVKLVDVIRQQAVSSVDERETPWYILPMFCNAAVVLLALSFVCGVNMLVMISIPTTLLPELVSMVPVELRPLLLVVPEMIVFCIVGFVISPAFKPEERLRWIIAFGVVASVIRLVISSGGLQESHTLLHRLGMVVTQLLPPWFALVGCTAYSLTLIRSKDVRNIP